MSELESLEKLRKAARGGFIGSTGNVVDNAKVLFGVSVPNGLDQVLFDTIADAIQEEVDSAYMRLPVDADGVPIRVGDLVALNGSEPFEVGGIRDAGNQWHVFPYDLTHWYSPLDLHHVKPRTLEDVITEYEELSVNQEVKKYFEVSNELRKIQREQFRDEPELELYKELHGYEFYIELPYDELLIMTEKVDVKHHSYSYRYKHPNGTTTYCCSSLCGYSRERAIEGLDEAIEEIERELLGADA